MEYITTRNHVKIGYIVKHAYLLDGERCNFGYTHDCKFLNVEELRTIRKEKGCIVAK